MAKTFQQVELQFLKEFRRKRTRKGLEEVVGRYKDIFNNNGWDINIVGLGVSFFPLKKKKGK